VAQLAVFHMKADCHMFAITNLVCNAGVLWFELEDNTVDCYHGSVYGIQALYNELPFPFLLVVTKDL